MPAIAVIGTDGAGKTTIIRMLLESSALPFRYVYMGINIEASNFALPTTRFVAYLRRRRAKKSRNARPLSITPHDRLPPKRQLIDKLRAVARLINRLAEAWYRQLVSWCYQLRGYIVLYDRHFMFDFALPTADSQDQPLDKRLHSWCLTHFYPRPDLAVYLDAPAEVLFARKGEWGIQYLETRRQALLRQGVQTRNFVQVDVTQPLDAVYTEVLNHIMRFHERHYRSTNATVGPSTCPDKR